MESEPEPEPSTFEVNQAASSTAPKSTSNQPANSAPQSKKNDSFQGDFRAMASRPKNGGNKPTREAKTVAFAPSDVPVSRPNIAKLATEVDTYSASYWAKQTAVPLTKRPKDDDGSDIW